MQFQWFLLVLCAEIAFSKTYLIETRDKEQKVAKKEFGGDVEGSDYWGEKPDGNWDEKPDGKRNTDEAEVKCEFSDFGEWTVHGNCGKVKKDRTRECKTTAGEDCDTCDGETTETGEEVLESCCVWSDWESGQCSATCGKGTMTNTRECTITRDPDIDLSEGVEKCETGVKGCEGEDSEEADCELEACPEGGVGYTDDEQSGWNTREEVTTDIKVSEEEPYESSESSGSSSSFTVFHSFTIESWSRDSSSSSSSSYTVEESEESSGSSTMEDDGDDIVVEPGHTDNQSVGGWGQR